MSAFSEFQVRFGKLKPIQWMSKSIRNKLLVAMMSAALIPLIAVAVAINSAASESLLTQTFDRLTAVRTIKATQVGDYLNTIKAQAATFAEDRMIVEAMTEFKAAFTEARQDNHATPEEVARMREELQSYYDVEFTKEYDKRNFGKTKADATRNIATYRNEIFAITLTSNCWPALRVC